MRLLFLTTLALAMAGCAQCGGADTPEAPPPQGTEPTPVESVTAKPAERDSPSQAKTKLEQPVRSSEHPAGTTGAELIAKAERKAHPSLRALRVASRKLLAADQAIVANQLGYSQAVEKTQREIKEMELGRRMPAEPVTVEALRPQVEALVLQSRLKLVELKVGAPAPIRAVPKTHPGPGPYEYHAEQLIGQQPVSIIVEPADDRNAAALYERLKGAPGVFIDVNAVMSTPKGERLMLSGIIPMLRAVDPPKQVVRTPSLSDLARQSGVELPQGDYPTEDIQKNLDAHRALLPELEKSMAFLAKTHLLGLQLRFARQRLETNRQRPFPKPMGRQGPGLPTTP